MDIFRKWRKSYLGWIRKNPRIHPCYHFGDFHSKMTISAWKSKFWNFSEFSLAIEWQKIWISRLIEFQGVLLHHNSGKTQNYLYIRDDKTCSKNVYSSSYYRATIALEKRSVENSCRLLGSKNWLFMSFEKSQNSLEPLRGLWSPIWRVVFEVNIGMKARFESF